MERHLKHLFYTEPFLIYLQCCLKGHKVIFPRFFFALSLKSKIERRWTFEKFISICLFRFYIVLLLLLLFLFFSRLQKTIQLWGQYITYYNVVCGISSTYSSWFFRVSAVKRFVVLSVFRPQVLRWFMQQEVKTWLWIYEHIQSFHLSQY